MPCKSGWSLPKETFEASPYLPVDSIRLATSTVSLQEKQPVNLARFGITKTADFVHPTSPNRLLANSKQLKAP